MAYRELIKNFEKIRSYMRDFYIDTMLPKMKEIAESLTEEKPNWNFLNDTFLKLIS